MLPSSWKIKLKVRVQHGFNFIEMAIVLIIVGVLIGAVTKAKMLLEDTKASDEMQTMPFVFRHLQVKYLYEPDTTVVTTANAITGKVFPPTVSVVGSTAINKFGGLITVSPATVDTPNDSFAVASEGLSSSACQMLVNGLRKMTSNVKIGAAAIMNSATLIPAQIDAACNAIDPVSVIFIIPKNG